MKALQGPPGRNVAVGWEVEVTWDIQGLRVEGPGAFGTWFTWDTSGSGSRGISASGSRLHSSKV